MKTKRIDRKTDTQEVFDRTAGIDAPTGVVSATETTGMFSAMPAHQAEADALDEIVHTHIPVVPKMGDGSQTKR